MNQLAVSLSTKSTPGFTVGGGVRFNLSGVLVMVEARRLIYVEETFSGGGIVTNVKRPAMISVNVGGTIPLPR
jgi:hypothetical protein